MPKVKRKTVAKSKSPAKTTSNPPTKPRLTERAKPSTKTHAKSKIVFFCNPDTEGEECFLSPWWRSSFNVKGVDYESVGQYILAEKARAFGDKRTLQRILDEDEIEVLKYLGQSIKDVEEKSWRRRALRIAKDANVHKFLSDDTESRDLLRQLKNLGERELVFADPSDTILGIGFSTTDATEIDRGQWGANVFGKSLDAVRATKAWREQAASKHRAFDTSIFDIGGRLSINW